MKARSLILIASLLIFVGCAELLNVIQSVSSVPLTEEEVINGLKEALMTGAKNAANKTCRREWLLW